MLRITADVNGHIIGYLFIHNTGRQSQGNVWEYDAAAWNPSIEEGTFGIEGIRHQRNKTWHDLVATIQAQVELNR